MNCLRGLAPSRYPLLRSVSRSAELLAELAATEADIKLWVMFFGDRTANSNCMTLPIAPMGVVSVSPVARQAAMQRTNDMTAATMPRGIEIWNAKYWTMTSPMTMGASPASSQRFGTSIAAIALAPPL